MHGCCGGPGGASDLPYARPEDQVQLTALPQRPGELGILAGITSRLCDTALSQGVGRVVHPR